MNSNVRSATSEAYKLLEDEAGRGILRRIYQGRCSMERYIDALARVATSTTD